MIDVIEREDVGTILRLLDTLKRKGIMHRVKNIYNQGDMNMVIEFSEYQVKDGVIVSKKEVKENDNGR